MCGILGGIFDVKVSGLDQRFSDALQLIAHRGPDDEGIYTKPMTDMTLKLGHKRLSIIDLSESGHQPMMEKDESFVLVYNGEIYNYRDIREELLGCGCNFISDSDTEVLLKGWQVWGTEILPKLKGMFSFVILDQKTKILTCARDGFGIKPFFYSDEEADFMFCSELAPLLSLKKEKPKKNYQRIYDYVNHGLQDGPDGTFISGITHLAPGHFLTYDLQAKKVSKIEKWWAPKIELKGGVSFSEAAKILREKFLESVKLHMVSDVPIGAALSGGIDSSAIVCAMRYLEPNMPIHTFSYLSEDKETNEKNWIDLVNSHVKAIGHKVEVGADDILHDFEDLIRAQGEPFNTTSIYAQFRIFKEARKQGIPVILEGQGADELLAGYNGYAGQRLRSLFEGLQFKKMNQFAHNWSSQRNVSPSVAWKSFAGQMLPEGLHNYMQSREKISRGQFFKAEILKKHHVALKTPFMGRTKAGKGRRVMEALSFSLTNNALPSLLRFGDRNAMFFSIENRVPFLNNDLADFLLSLPEEYLISKDGTTKAIFREAMKGIVPEPILERKDKIGFETPMHLWLRANADYFEELFNSLDDMELINKESILLEWQSFLKGEDLTIETWRIINLLAWKRSIH